MPVANPTTLTGAEASTDNVANNPIDMDSRIAELEPNAAPLVRLMEKLSTRPAQNPKIQWLENQPMPRITTLSASATSAATALGVTADIFRVGDVVRITETGEAIEVTATATGAITATRNIGRVTKASATSAAELYIVANVNAEGSSLREIRHVQLVNASNYCEIFRWPFGLTGTEDATEHYGGDERTRLQNNARIEVSRQIEAAAFFGARDLNTTNKRFTGGLYEFIQTNVTADTGGLTQDDLETFLRSGFRYGSDRKLLFASPKVFAAVDKFARTSPNALTTEQSNGANTAASFGIAVQQYVCSQGIVDLIMHRDWNDSAIYGGYGFLVDLPAVRMAPLRPMKLRQNVHAPDYDGFKDEYLAEIGFEIRLEARHALLTGVT